MYLKQLTTGASVKDIKKYNKMIRIDQYCPIISGAAG